MDEIFTVNTPIVDNGESIFDDNEIINQIAKSFNFNQLRSWNWTDPLREGAANVIHKLDNSAMETERLQSLIGLDDNQFIEAVRAGRVRREEWPLGKMPRERRDDLLRGEVAKRLNWQENINKTANYIAPSPHAAPEGVSEKLLMKR